MRAIIQRVTEASVEVDNEVLSHISEGLLVLIGLCQNDTPADIEYITHKTIGLRIFNDEDGMMNRSVEDIDGEILLVSQFTLYGDVRKGKRPSFSNAMPPQAAADFFNIVIETFREKYNKVKTGRFGAHMNVSLMNSGPVTIMLDSSKIF